MDAARNPKPITDAERIDRLRLIRTDNVGPRTFRSLLDHFGSARAALTRLPDLAQRGGATRDADLQTPARSFLRARSSASICWRRKKPAIRHGWQRSTTHRRRSACVVRSTR